MEKKIIDKYPLEVMKPNIMGAINCLEFLKKQKEERSVSGRMVIFSSVTIYGNITGNDLVVGEEDTQVTIPLDASNAIYSQSKRMSEVISRAYSKQYGLDIVIARLSTVYGNTFFKPETAFFEFINRALSGENITLRDSGVARRDNIYIDDAVSGILLLGLNGTNCEVYNVSSNGEMGNFAAVDEIASIIIDLVNEKYNINIKLINQSSKNKIRRSGIVLSNIKLKNLGWNVKTSLREGIAKTLKVFEEKK